MSSTIANERSKPKRKRQKISQLSRQQIWNRKKELHVNVSQELQFLDDDGVHASTVTLVRNSTTNAEVLDLTTGSYSKQDNTTPTNDMAELALFVKDRFGLSDVAYHQLCRICDRLPRLCQLKKLSSQLNSQWEIQLCPGNNGIQQSFASRLEKRVKHLQQQNLLKSNDTLKVKISGDGTKVCRKLNLINITFTLLNEGTIAMPPGGNHTIAIIKGTEDYDTLKTALSDLSKEIEELTTMTINHVTYTIEYHQCADLKFLAMVCGVYSATATYSCMWCKCPSTERHNMDKQWSISDQTRGARTIEDIISCHKKSRGERYGCKFAPIFKAISIDHVIPDMLHLFLRITDVFFNLLIVDIRRHDALESISSSQSNSPSPTYLHQLEFFINTTCKIPFKFSYGGDKKNELQYRDLMGPEKHIVFKKSPLQELFPNLPNIKDIQQLWDDFYKAYSILQQEHVSIEKTREFEMDAQKWIKSFTAIYQSKMSHPTCSFFKASR